MPAFKMRPGAIGLCTAAGILLAAWHLNLWGTTPTPVPLAAEETSHKQQANGELLHSVQQLQQQLELLNKRISALEATPLRQRPQVAIGEPGTPAKPVVNYRMSTPTERVVPVAPVETWSAEVADTEWQMSTEEELAGFDAYLYSMSLPALSISDADCRESLCKLTFAPSAELETFKIQHFLATYLPPSYAVVEVSTQSSKGNIFLRRN